MYRILFISGSASDFEEDETKLSKETERKISNKMDTKQTSRKRNAAYAEQSHSENVENGKLHPPSLNLRELRR